MAAIEDNTTTCEEVIEFIREWGRIPSKKAIRPETRLESDLGITGDDGSDLLEAAEKRFSMSFSEAGRGLRPAFGLADNEYLFHSEPTLLLILQLFGLWREKVHPLTVGQLHQVILERKAGAPHLPFTSSLKE